MCDKLHKLINLLSGVSIPAKIYAAVYNKIRRLTKDQLVNTPLTLPLSEEVTDLTSAKKAYQALYDNLEKRASASVLFVIYAPTLLTDLLTRCLGDAFLTEQNRQKALLIIRFLAMEEEKNTAIYKTLGVLAPQGKHRDPDAQQALVSHIETAETAIASIHHKVHNCISISTLVIFELRSRGIPAEQIELFEKRMGPNGPDDDAHAFVVVGRKAGSDKNNMLTWGDDCYIIDPWYGYYGKALELCQDAERFRKYYLIVNLQDKTPTTCSYPEGILNYYIMAMKQALPPDQEIDARLSQHCKNFGT